MNLPPPPPAMIEEANIMDDEQAVAMDAPILSLAERYREFYRTFRPNDDLHSLDEHQVDVQDVVLDASNDQYSLAECVEN